MQTDYQSLFLTSLTPSELKVLLRQELQSFFKDNQQGPQLKEEDHLLNVKEAAFLLKYSVASIYRLINSKEIPNLKRGGKVLFSKEELIEWAKAGRRKTISEIAEDAERHLASLGDKKRADNLKSNPNEK